MIANRPAVWSSSKSTIEAEMRESLRVTHELAKPVRGRSRVIAHVEAVALGLRTELSYEIYIQGNKVSSYRPIISTAKVVGN